MRLRDLLQAKREDVLRLAEQYGARNVRIFGSVARGEDDEQSDIDLLVDMEPGRSLLEVVGLWQDLQELLECNVDVVTEGSLREHEPLHDTVLKDAILL